MASYSNVIQKEEIRKIYSWSLRFLSKVLSETYGPKSSNTEILKNGSHNIYSKDGHTVLKNIHFNDVIEEAIVADMCLLTQEIANTVGDGTTSAVILSSLLYEAFMKMEELDTIKPYEFMERFTNFADRVKEEILTRAEEFTPEMAYKIAYISTNGNAEVAEKIEGFYKKYGKELYIEIIASPNKDSYIREFDGLTLDSGYADTAYQNVAGKAQTIIRNASVYAFEHPIDTPSMGELFQGIILNNIIQPLSTNPEKVIPTVILAPRIGQDYDYFMSTLAQTLLQYKDVEAKPPLLIVTNIGSTSLYEDISLLCGCKWIKKFIDPKVREEEAKKGNVATLTNIENFAGFAGMVKADSESTVFISPKSMYEKDGSYSQMYESILQNYKNEIAKAEAEEKDLSVVGGLKRKLHALQSNMIQYAVGGVSVGARDSLRHLLEDAVKSCQSASKYGVGQAANVEGLMATEKLKDIDPVIGEIVADAYKELVLKLYSTCLTKDEAKEALDSTLQKGTAFDLRALDFNGNVLGSIMADVVILETISKILGLMITCNQILLPEPKYAIPYRQTEIED